MIEVSISEEIANACPDLHLAVIQCEVNNSESSEKLWNEIHSLSDEIRNCCPIEEVNKFKPIYATRQAYKRLGKDPNRYRPSSEALRRRIVRGLPLYQIDTLVDITNLVSIKIGYSIGGFDADKISGALILGVGREGEEYHGIGRGILNIEGLPVYRDDKGGVGTPTSDEERTKIEMTTTHLLMIINGYSGSEGLAEAASYSESILREYAGAKNIDIRFISAS